MIRVRNISKRFRGRPAVEDVSFEVAPGEVFGLLGHNGAGKSTTFGIALGHLRADAGQVVIGGHDVATNRRDALRRVGAIYETPAFYDYLSGWKNLQFFVSLSERVSRSRMEEIVTLVGLEMRIHEPVRVYSHGMRQRLALAQALLPNPQLILLDEPTEGLDPIGIHEMRAMIWTLRKDHGMTVVLSSHLLHEVEQLCDRVAILHRGNLVFCGKWQDAENGAPRWRVETDDPAKCLAVLAPLGASDAGDGCLRLPPRVDPADAIAALVHAGVRVGGFASARPTLEDFYLARAKS